jgi:capsular polysaccharide biosynthesis protein
MRMPGPPMAAGPRFAPQPPPRRHLTGGQRSRLVLLTVVLMVVGAFLGYAASLVLPSQYAARTTIQYNIAGENTGDFLKTDRNLTTQVVLLTSRNVLGPVADANGVSVDSLTKQVSASILNSSDIIQLQVKSSDPTTAVSLANAVAKQYLTVANGSGPQGYLQGQLDAVKKQQTAAGTTAADLAALSTRAATLQAQLDQLNLTQNQSSVLVPAYPLTDPVSPNKSLAGLTGGICGLIIALMTVVTLSRRWSRN